MCQQDTTFEMFGLCDVRIRAVARRLSESGRYSIGIWHTIIISWHQDNAAWRSPSRHYYTTNFRFLSKFSLLFLNFIITTNTLGFLLATKLILHIPRRSSSSLLDGLYFIWLNCYISSYFGRVVSSLDWLAFFCIRLWRRLYIPWWIVVLKRRTTRSSIKGAMRRRIVYRYH
jgi:hypothetical protein